MADNNIIEKLDIDAPVMANAKEVIQELRGLIEQAEQRTERYDLSWVGKARAFAEAGMPINKTLRPDLEESVNFNETENLFITGDNLDALKILQESYLGKVDMIYIDPPYNTGKDFVYHDKFGKTMAEMKEASKDTEGNRQFTVNSRDNGRFHSDWLSMMYPRLRIARNLLSDNGVIFISIDDNEQANLKLLCDEVFGEGNFVNCISINMSNMSGPKVQHAITGKRFPKIKEYLLLYTKNADRYKLHIPKIPKEKWDAEYNLIIPNFTRELAEQLESGEYFDNINEVLKGMKLVSLNQFIKENDIEDENDEWKFKNSYRIFASKPNTALLKLAKENKEYEQDVFVLENASEQQKLITTKFNRESRTARIELVSAYSKSEIFFGDQWGDIVTTGGIGAEGGVPYPNAKKPLKMIERMIYSSNIKDRGLVLDFFAGSSSTAHAVMKYNIKNKAKLKYIMVQIAENLDEALKTAEQSVIKDIKRAIDFLDSIGKPHTIDQISRERIRRAAVKLCTRHADESQHPQLFEEIADHSSTTLTNHVRNDSLRHNDAKDYGFRAFRIDTTNTNDSIFKIPAETTQRDLFSAVDNIKKERTPLDLLFATLTAMALEMNRQLRITNYELREGEVQTLYVYDYFGELSGLLACFDEKISEATILEMARMKPLAAVFRDSSFATAADKINLKEHFRTISPDTKLKVI